MNVKMLEIRDAATFIPVMAVEIDRDIMHQADQGQYLLARAGFGKNCRYILYTPLVGSQPYKTTYDQYSHEPSRTHLVAHEYIIREWDNIETGDVIDVEYILGLRDEPKTSERWDTD